MPRLTHWDDFGSMSTTPRQQDSLAALHRRHHQSGAPEFTPLAAAGRLASQHHAPGLTAIRDRPPRAHRLPPPGQIRAGETAHYRRTLIAVPCQASLDPWLLPAHRHTVVYTINPLDRPAIDRRCFLRLKSCQGPRLEPDSAALFEPAPLRKNCNFTEI
jgi:hypothetical protein